VGLKRSDGARRLGGIGLREQSVTVSEMPQEVRVLSEEEGSRSEGSE